MAYGSPAILSIHNKKWTLPLILFIKSYGNKFPEQVLNILYIIFCLSQKPFIAFQYYH